MTTTITQICVGIDISKSFLDIHFYPLESSLKVNNSKVGIAKLLLQLSKYDIKQIIWESSGGYDFLLRKMLNAHAYKTWQVEAKRIKAFIVSEGIKAKTDTIDARMIALFAATKQQKHASIKQTEAEEKLKAYTRRRTDLLAMVTIENNRAQHPQQIHTKKRITKHIAFMKKELKEIEKKINHLLSKDSKLSNKARIIKSIPGVGEVTAAVLISHMPELGTKDSKQIASLLGVAPFDKQSGMYKGCAVSKGGRFHVRKVVYMAALTASIFNPKLKCFYEKLRKAGKKPKVALIAVMRKLITILNIMLMRGEVWCEN